MPPGGSRRLAGQRAVYRALLVFYPSSFRREYRDAMVQAFEDQASEPRRRRRGLWLRTIRDLLASAPTVPLEEGMMRSTGVIIVGVLAAMVAVGVLAVGGFTFPGMVTAVIALAVVGALVTGSAVFARRNGRPTEHVYGGPTSPWNWWTVLAALLGLFFLIGAIVENIADPKIENVGGLAFFGGAGVAIFAGIKMRAQSKPAGDWLIAVGALPGVLLFWIIGPAVAALVVMVSAISENVRLREAPARA
jgi:hypothetical protein